MTKKLTKALQEQKKDTKQEVLQITGTLGIPLGGTKLTEVPNRKSFVYVKLRDNQNEVIQAFNNKVAPGYGLPVVVERQNNRYVVIGVDTLRYQNNWNSFSPYLPRHGSSHSFNEVGGGGDMVWVYPRQFMPALIIPSGSSGGPNVILSSYTLKNADGSWKYVGITGTANLIPYKPTNNQAVMVLVYLDTISGNPYLMVGSGSYFAGNITGTPGILPYVPSITNINHIPLSAVRLVSGTSSLSWDNIYDVRQFLPLSPTGTSGGGNLTIWDEGIPLGTATTLNFVGNGVDVSISGSVARVHISGSTGGGASNLTGTSIGTPNRMLASNSSGFITTDTRIGWNLNGNNGFLEFGVNVAGKESNAGKVGYALFDTMLDIVGAGFTGSGTRWVHIYDALYSDLLQGQNFNSTTLRNSWIYLNDTGTMVGPTNAPESSSNISGGYQFLGLDSNNNYLSTKISLTTLAGTVLPRYLIPPDGWVEATETWTRTGNFTFTIVGNYLARYQKGTKVRYVDNAGFEYGIVASVSSGGGLTTVTLITNNDYAMAATTITSKSISSVENPEGWPDWFNYTPTYSASGSMTYTDGAGGQPTTTYAKYRVSSKTLEYKVAAVGTTGVAGSISLIASAPCAAVDSNQYAGVCSIRDATSGAQVVGTGFKNGATDEFFARKFDNAAYTLGAGRIMLVAGTYPI